MTGKALDESDCPESIASAHAGPLLCAGTTVFAPLLRYGVRPTDRVAVLGIGGLGHLAVQYLAGKPQRTIR